MDYKTICKKCDKHKPVYKSGLCKECDGKVMLEKQLQMKEKRGPVWQKWKEGMRRYLDEDAEADEADMQKLRKLARKKELARKRARRKPVVKRSLSKQPKTRAKHKKLSRKNK
ncbi:hypothetical protein ES703_60298 [subsurface metagenome]